MFLKLRAKLINWLAGEDIAVIINTVVYDYVLEANETLGKDCLFERNKIVSLDNYIDAETYHRMILAKQGVRKQGNSFILDHSLR